jgi:predicted transcriptional regulator
MELDESQSKTVTYSTSLPKGLKKSLHKSAGLLHRKKSDWIRTALNLFLSQSEKEQDRQILNNYQEIGLNQLEPFTTTLYESQIRKLEFLSKTLKRSKAEILRTAIFLFSKKDSAKQEAEIKKYLSW